MKRFRDSEGKLTKSLAEIAAATAEEAAAYYVDGQYYIVDGRKAVFHCGIGGGLVLFETVDGYKTYFDPDKLGTFLPDVADDDLAIVKA